MDNQDADQIFKLLQQIDARLVRIEQKFDQEHQSEFDDPDPLLKDAATVTLKYSKASASLYQRYLQIGYARAAMILDQMYKLGLVSEADGAKPREIYVDKINQYLSKQQT